MFADKLIFRWRSWTIALTICFNKFFPPGKANGLLHPLLTAVGLGGHVLQHVPQGQRDGQVGRFLCQVFHSLLIAACPITWTVWGWVLWEWEGSTRWEPQCLMGLPWAGKSSGGREPLSRDNSLMSSRGSSRRQGRLLSRYSCRLANHCFSLQVSWYLYEGGGRPQNQPSWVKSAGRTFRNKKR